MKEDDPVIFTPKKPNEETERTPRRPDDEGYPRIDSDSTIMTLLEDPHEETSTLLERKKIELRKKLNHLQTILDEAEEEDTERKKRLKRLKEQLEQEKEENFPSLEKEIQDFEKEIAQYFHHQHNKKNRFFSGLMSFLVGASIATIVAATAPVSLLISGLIGLVSAGMYYRARKSVGNKTDYYRDLALGQTSPPLRKTFWKRTINTWIPTITSIAALAMIPLIATGSLAAGTLGVVLSFLFPVVGIAIGLIGYFIKKRMNKDKEVLKALAKEREEERLLLALEKKQTPEEKDQFQLQLQQTKEQIACHERKAELMMRLTNAAVLGATTVACALTFIPGFSSTLPASATTSMSFQVLGTAALLSASPLAIVAFAVGLCVFGFLAIRAIRNYFRSKREAKKAKEKGSVPFSPSQEDTQKLTTTENRSQDLSLTQKPISPPSSKEKTKKPTEKSSSSIIGTLALSIMATVATAFFSLGVSLIVGGIATAGIIAAHRQKNKKEALEHQKQQMLLTGELTPPKKSKKSYKKGVKGSEKIPSESAALLPKPKKRWSLFGRKKGQGSNRPTSPGRRIPSNKEEESTSSYHD